MKIGLVLSGGGARAMAHLGIMQALIEHGISFHIISGSSAGALVGAFYCAGHKPQDISKIGAGINIYNTFRPAFNWRSLLNMERASVEFSKYLPETFEELEIPLRVNTTDIGRAKPKVFKKGHLIKPLLASCCIPVLFDPIVIGSRTLVDGGITDNLPHKCIKKECDIILALHCNPVEKGYTPGNWRNLMERSMMLTMTQIVHSRKKYYDIFMEPPGLGQYRVFDFKKSEEIYHFGYQYGQQAITEGVLNKLGI